MSTDIVYNVQGRYWDIDVGGWVEEPDSSKEVIILRSNGKPAGEDVLLKTLKLHNYALGEFDTSEPTVSLEDQVASLTERVTTLESVLGGIRENLASFQSSEENSEELTYGV